MAALATAPASNVVTASVPYFAYGSNLSRAQMRARCPHARFVGRTMIGGYRLVFAGHSQSWGGAVATLVPSRGGCVPGLLYELSPACIARLDAFEGHPHTYVRVRVRVRVAQDDGRLRYAQTYALPPMRQGRPSARYLEQLAREYVRYGFSLQPLFDAALAGGAA